MKLLCICGLDFGGKNKTLKMRKGRPGFENDSADSLDREYPVCMNPQLRYRHSTSRTSRSERPESCYSSSSLDEEPTPGWTPYAPKNGIAWVPKRTNSANDNSTSFRRSSSNGSINNRTKMPERDSLLNVSRKSFTSVKSSSHCNNKCINNNSITRGHSVADIISYEYSVIENGIYGSQVLNRDNRTVNGSSGSPSGSNTSSSPTDQSRGSPWKHLVSGDDSTFADWENYHWDTAFDHLDKDDDDDEDDVFVMDDAATSDASDSSYDDDSELACDHEHDGDQFTNNKELHRSTEDKELQKFLAQHDLSDIIIEREDLRTGKLIFRGEHFSVCSGCYKMRHKRYQCYVKPVTVHIFRGLNSDQDRVRFLKNVIAMRRLSHAHVLGVIGVCHEGSPVTRDGNEVIMITQKTHFLISLRRLLQWTGENNRELLTPRCSVQFALEICAGLRYLREQGTIHTNLTSSTVMLDGNCQVKLGGIEHYPLSTSTSPYRWMALETLEKGRKTPDSPTWSFAVILWEIISVGVLPYPHLQNKEDVYIYLSKGKRLIPPPRCSKFSYKLMLSCWIPKPRNRPSLDQLMDSLSSHQRQLPPSRSAREIFPDREDFWRLVQDFVC